jgi:hypothetical protein
MPISTMTAGTDTDMDAGNNTNGNAVPTADGLSVVCFAPGSSPLLYVYTISGSTYATELTGHSVDGFIINQLASASSIVWMAIFSGGNTEIVPFNPVSSVFGPAVTVALNADTVAPAVVVSPDGSTAYVYGHAAGKVGVLNIAGTVARFVGDITVPNASNGQLAIDAAGANLYVPGTGDTIVQLALAS